MPTEQTAQLELATPPDNRPLHNPDKLTAEQVGVGYRLTLPEEWNPTQEYWHSTKQWKKSSHYSSLDTFRLPLSVPWPEPVDPYAEPATKEVELGPEDILPGSVLGLGDRKPHTWHGVQGVFLTTVVLRTFRESYSFTELKDEKWLINRSIPLTGKWNPDAWEPCSKQIPA